MKLVVAALLALSMVGTVYAHGEPDLSPEVQQQRMCQRAAAHAAWGADSAFKGAPAVFKYLPYEEMKALYDQDAVPTDAIYGADTDDAEAKKNFEVAVYAGWKQAQGWMKEEDKVKPGVHALMAIFMQVCHKPQMQ